MKNTVLIMVMLLAAGGCQQLTPLQHWNVAGQSYAGTANVLGGMYEAGELGDEEIIQIAEYGIMADEALDEWLASIMAGESFTRALSRFNVVFDKLILMQRKDK